MTNYCLPNLTIVHNHGRLHLRNVELTTLDPRWPDTLLARGNVVDGYSTDRLMHASKTTHATPGEVREWPLYGRKIQHFTDGTNYVDVCFC